MRHLSVRWVCPLIVIAAVLGLLLPALVGGADYVSPAHPERVTDLGWRGWVTIAVVLMVFLAFVLEVLSPEVIMISGAAFLAIAQVISVKGLLSGFALDILVVLAMLFIMVKGLEVNGVLSLLTNLFLPKKGSHRYHLAVMLPPVSVLSAFMNNTPIVLILTTVVRRWAREMKTTPSKYLMPISFATILGGICTLIGTSANLVVDGMLRAANPDAQLAFFDLALIGVPSVVFGLTYLILFGPKLLPSRPDPAAAASEETRQFTAEFRVLPDSPLVGKTITDASLLYFHGEYLIEIVREGQRIHSPSPRTQILSDDRLVFTTDVDRLARLHSIAGLESIADPSFQLNISSPYFSEVVVAINSWLIGKTLRRANFRTHYRASVVAIYRQGIRVAGLLGDIVLSAGDTLLLLSNQPWRTGSAFQKDFYTIQHSRELPVFRPRAALLIGVVMFGFIVSVTLKVPIFYASLCAGGILLITGSVSLQQARAGIDWRLLLLIAGAFSLGGAIASSGVAYLIARNVLKVVGSEPHLLIGAIYLILSLVTEMVTNVAAAMMLFPIALDMVSLAGYSGAVTVKAVGVTVAIAASSSFLTPIGYQTNTIIYGPGGYRFLDYLRLGAALNIAQLLIAALLIPYFWPLQ